MAELRSYYLLDITKMATNFFSDYVVNFISQDTQQIVSVLNPEDSTNNEAVTTRLNEILLKDIKIIDYIRDHINDYVFYGGYYSMLQTQRDEKGHLVFRTEELNNPNAVVIKKKKNEDGNIEDIFLAIGDDGNLYEIPSTEVIYISNPKLRLTNDLEEGWKAVRTCQRSDLKRSGFGAFCAEGSENRNKVLRKESFMASEPLFYSSILKIKELVIKELLISLISLRDLSSPQLLGLNTD